MTIIQQASGTFTGTSFTPTLPTSSDPSNRVVLTVAANTVITAPSGFTLRSSQVNYMGHYLLDTAGGGAVYTVECSAGQGTWWIAEVAAGVYDTAVSVNNPASTANFSTPELTPSAGNKLVLASLGCLNSEFPRTISGWTNGFAEQADVCWTANDRPMQGVASVEIVASGAATYSTAATYSIASVGSSAIIASYGTSSSAGTSYTQTVADAVVITDTDTSQSIGVSQSISDDVIVVDSSGGVVSGGAVASPSARVYGTVVLTDPAVIPPPTSGASVRVYTAPVVLTDPASPPSGANPSARVYTYVTLADPATPPIRVSVLGGPWQNATILASVNGGPWQ